MDIDKLYVLGYEIGKNGVLRTFSNLQRGKDDFDSLMKLTKPNGIKYSEGESDTIITKRDIRALNNGDYSVIERIMNSSDGVIAFANGISKYAKKNFLRILNSHTTTKLKGESREVALRNSAVDGILSVMRKARTQIPAHNPINMDDFQELSSHSTLSNKEKRMTSDNPVSKFIMQVQNMVGKDVIGIEAVSLKVFFATTAFVTMRVKQIAENIELYKNAETDSEKQDITKNIKLLLNDIVFQDPLTGDIATLANINFELIQEALGDLDINLLDYSEMSDLENNSIQPIVNSVESLKDTILRLAEMSDLIDAADGISGLLSAATDNAKELILSKINATVDFADTWSYLISMGHSVEEIGSILMDDVFTLVGKYTKGNILSPVMQTGNVKNAVEFVLGRSQLQSIDHVALNQTIKRWPKKHVKGTEKIAASKDNTAFINKLRYETWRANDPDLGDHTVGEIKLNAQGNPTVRTFNPFTPEGLESLTRKDSELRADLPGLLNNSEMFDSDEIRQFINPKMSHTDAALLLDSILMDHLHYMILNRRKIESTRRRHSDDGEDIDALEASMLAEDYEHDDYGQDDNTGYDDWWAEEDASMYDEYESQARKYKDFDESRNKDFKADDYTKLYLYLKNFVLAKNTELRKIDSPSRRALLRSFLENIQPGVEEQQILGGILGVNQGLPTNAYDFVAKIRRIEKFITQRFAKLSDEVKESHAQYLDFNLLRFLEDKTYRKESILLYGSVKSSRNVLDVISNVPNFKEMFKTYLPAHRLMENSLKFKVLRKLEQALLNDPTKSFNKEEWDKADAWVRDVFIVNWFNKLAKDGRNIIQVPQNGEENGVPVYAKTWRWNGDSFEGTTSQEFINLSTSEGRASFINIFENWVKDYIKNTYTNNAFSENLKLGYKESSLYGVVFTHAKLAMNIMNSDASEVTKDQYSAILSDFNKIADEIIPELGLTIKDALFMYNLLIYKNGYSQNGFTKLLETINMYKDTLMDDYSTFISDLDSGKIDLGSINSEDVYAPLEVNTKTGEVISGALKMNIWDLLYRFSFNSSAESKYKIRQDRNGDNQIQRVVFLNNYGNDLDPAKDGEEYIAPIECYNPNANDFAMNMPVLENTAVEIEETPYEGKTRRGLNNLTIIGAINSRLNDKLNIPEGSIQFISKRQIAEAWQKQQNPDIEGDFLDLTFSGRQDYERTLDARGFINNGIIYIVNENMSADTMLHELSHVILAWMKFNPDDSIRSEYYRIIDTVYQDMMNNDRDTFDDMKELYRNTATASDFKEEVFVYYLGKVFTTLASSKFNAYATRAEVKELAKEVIDQMFDISLPSDFNTGKLGKTSLDALLSIFHSPIFEKSGSLFEEAQVQLSQEMQEIKRKLIQGQDPENNIIYNC